MPQPLNLEKQIHEGPPMYKKEMSRLLELAYKFNKFYVTASNRRDVVPFFANGYQIGLIRSDVLKHLLPYSSVFTEMKDVSSSETCSISLHPSLKDYEDRSLKLEQVLKDLRSRNVLPTLKGWRDETYEVRVTFSSKALLRMDRSATRLFGICNYGVDITGYVRHPIKGLCIWLQQRSATKQTWPGKWDNMVGGGLSSGYGVMDTALKEAEEEASISEDLMKGLQAGGSVSFYYESDLGLSPNTEFVFDLELPLDFVPKNKDGEVEKFELLTAQEALERAFTEDFKTTSSPVLIDFLIRHNFINPDTELYYPHVVELLHVPLQSFYSGFCNNITQVQGDGKIGQTNGKSD